MKDSPAIRIALAGLGNVGRNVLSILHSEEDALYTRYGLRFAVTGVIELGGGAVDPDGLDLASLLNTIDAKKPVAELPDVGRPGLTWGDLAAQAAPHMFLDATPVNIVDGQPGLDMVVSALRNNIDVVTSNKGPLTVAYGRLKELSDLHLGWGHGFHAASDTLKEQLRPKLRFSACVGGALPTINLGWRDLAGCAITRVEAVFNGTTHSILRAMETGQSYYDALLDAQRRGIAEADPSLDVDGWDAACKLVITANAVLGQPTTLADVKVEGIRDVNHEMVKNALARGRKFVLLCLAERKGNDSQQPYQLSVKPTELPLDHPLARLTPDEMGVVYYSSSVDRLSAASDEPTARPAAAAMVRDMIDIAHINYWASRPTLVSK